MEGVFSTAAITERNLFRWRSETGSRTLADVPEGAVDIAQLHPASRCKLMQDVAKTKIKGLRSDDPPDRHRAVGIGVTTGNDQRHGVWVTFGVIVKSRVA